MVNRWAGARKEPGFVDVRITGKARETVKSPSGTGWDV
jgi:hypothetical protein